MGERLEKVAEKLLAQKPSMDRIPHLSWHSSRGRNKSKKNKMIHRYMTLASWNVRTLLDSDNAGRPERRTALIAGEFARYGVDICALQETRFAGRGTLEEVGGDYTFFWSGLPEGQRRLHGVAFSIRTSLLRTLPGAPTAVNERLIKWRLPLSQGRNLTLICAYAPTLLSEEATKDRFYEELTASVRGVDKTDKLIILGDFNARVGSNQQLWKNVLGPHGKGRCNENGLLLLSFCAENELLITNTIFQLRDMHKTTWKHPRSCQWHLLDYVLVRQADRR